MLKEFEKFTQSENLLQIWSGGRIVFESKKNGVAGLLDFIKENNKKFTDLIIFDSKIGNAAALLFTYLGVKEVYGTVGSQLAIKNLDNFKIKFYFKKTIPNILNRDESDLCPFEKLSLDKTPEEFYQCLLERGSVKQKTA
jgi:hypothetical protein